MKLPVFYLVAISTLMACSQQEKEKNILIDEIEEQVIRESRFVHFDLNEEQVMSRYFTDESLVELDNLLGDFDSLSKEDEFYRFLDVALVLGSQLSENINKSETSYLTEIRASSSIYRPFEVMSQDIEKIEQIIHPFLISVVPESDQMEMGLDLDALYSKSTQTSGKCDDEFFGLALFIDGHYLGCDFYGPGCWNEKGTNGASLIGGGIMIDLINKINHFEANYSCFETQIEEYKTRMFTGLVYSKNFVFSQQKVKASYHSILAMDFFTESEEVEIEKVLKAITVGSENFSFNEK